ncbi:MAG: hypothetical protein OXI95_09285 [bacterium]|nr:hypothetical protein [bacterium]
MTERKDLLRPLEPAQRLAPADRKMLEALQATIAECNSLISAQGETTRQAAELQQEMLQACADRLGRLAASINAASDSDAARHAELMEAVGRIPTAIAGLPESLDGASPEHLAGMRADLAEMRVTLERVAATQELHGLELLAMARAFEALGIALVAWRNQTHGAEVIQAHLGQTRALGDLARNTTSLAARFAEFEALLVRRKGSFWLLVTIPLLLGFVYGAGLMTDVMIRILDGSAGLTMPLVTEFMFWLSPGSGPEAAPPE